MRRGSGGRIRAREASPARETEAQQGRQQRDGLERGDETRALWDMVRLDLRRLGTVAGMRERPSCCEEEEPGGTPLVTLRDEKITDTADRAAILLQQHLKVHSRRTGLERCFPEPPAKGVVLAPHVTAVPPSTFTARLAGAPVRLFFTRSTE